MSDGPEEPGDEEPEEAGSATPGEPGGEEPVDPAPDEPLEEDGVPLGDLADRVGGRRGPRGDSESGADPGSPGTPREEDGVPLGDLADRVDRRRERREDRDGVMDAFEAVEIDEVDPDRLWAELEADDIDETVDEPRSAAERDVRVIDKRAYCQRCHYFSEPPEVRCTHEGTEIIELTDVEHFRVADCPIVRGEEDLEAFRR